MKPSRIVKSAHKGRPQPLKAFVRDTYNELSALTLLTHQQQQLADACKAWLKAKGLLPEGKVK